MSMRVATFAMNEKMLNASLRTQSRMAELQLQEARGTVSSDYGGMGASSQKLISLEVSMQRSKSYSSAASEASGRVQIMYSTLDTINDIFSNFRSAITALRSTDASDETRAALSTTAQTYMEELATLLNTQYEGRYLFSGSATTTQPVNLDAYLAGDADTADTSYYQGNADLASVQVSAEQTVSYGVTAADPAFEKAFRVLSTIANANGDFDDDLLASVTDVLLGAIDGAAALQGTLSVNAATLERAQTREADYQSFLESGISNVRDVDVTALTVTLTGYQTQLQAAYAAMAKIMALNLSNYLK